MTKSIECTGATIEAAIEAALKELNMQRDDVTVEVLEKGKSGFFGLGAVDARVRVSYSEGAQERLRTFLDGLLREFGVEAKIDIREGEDDTLLVELSGPNMGMVIGRRGDTLDSIQYLTSLVINRCEEKHYRVVIDTENYRAKREESLVRLANKMAGKVLKYKKSMTLEPMNPYERRIIHSALQDTAGVTTYSTGTEPNRRVVVALAGAARRDGKRPYNPNSGRGPKRPQ